jgi:hypothetical protein
VSHAPACQSRKNAPSPQTKLSVCLLLPFKLTPSIRQRRLAHELAAQGRQRLYSLPSIRHGRLAHELAAQGIGAEFAAWSGAEAARSAANWSG